MTTVSATPPSLPAAAAPAAARARPPRSPARRAGTALGIITGAALVRLALAALLPPVPDETYYWEWSRHLASGYFDHPPAIAFLIRFGDALFARMGAAGTSLALRAGPILASWIAALATVGIARRLSGGRGGAEVRAAVLVTVIPLAAAGLVLATPDVPLLAATAIGLYAALRALASPVDSGASMRWWVITGLALGLAFSSKLTSILLPVGVLAAIVIRPSLRPRLSEPGPYVACAIAFLVFLPVLHWNARHDWIEFTYQLRHGLSASPGPALRAAWRHEGDLLGGQAALASPILFIMFAVAVGRGLRRRASDARFVLAMVALVSGGFFAYSALRHRVEPNWPALAYVPAIALLAATSWGPAGKRWWKPGVVLAAAMSALIYLQALVPILPIQARRDPVARAFGWSELAQQASAAAQAASRETGHHTWLAADRYQEASELAFHIPSHPRTFALNLAGRPNQYDLWPGFADVAQPGDNLVVALDESDGLPAPIAALASNFATVEPGPLVSLRRGRGLIGTRRLWVLKGWSRGISVPPTTELAALGHRSGPSARPFE